MRLLRAAGLIYLLVMLSVIWGFLIGRHGFFPYRLFDTVDTFVLGTEHEPEALLDRLASDFDIRPERFLMDQAATPPSAFERLDLVGLNDRREQPQIRLADSAPLGHRFLVGAFDFVDGFWGALLLDAEGAVVNRWILSTEGLKLNKEPDHRKNLYGVDILPDGSVVFLMQEPGGGIVKADYCGRRQWVLDGRFHHTVELTDRGTFWTYQGNFWDFDHVLAEVHLETGEILRTIDMEAVRTANPSVHIFDLQRAIVLSDAVHGNDIDELPARLAGAFPGFEPGDLLLSYRTINLLFVIDPENLKIKWWRVGAWDRQHDPDWNPGGYISVFSNNERGVGNHSNIVAIDPASFEHRILVDGAGHDFYSDINGMHQVTPQGTTLITSSRQGRVFEVDRTGRVVFDFVNTYDHAQARSLHMSNARFLEPGYFDFDVPPTCKETES